MIECHFKDIRSHILKEIYKAESDIKVAVCWFTQRELFDALCEILQSDGERQITITLIILNDRINNVLGKLPFQHFIEIGGRFYYSTVENPVHNKYCIIDDRVVINGSYNWTKAAEERNEENISIISESSVVNAYVQDFNRLINGRIPVTKIEDVANLSSRDMQIVEGSSIAMEDDIITSSSKVIDSQLRLKSTIGETLHNDRFQVFFKKGREIPAEEEMELTTVNDLQVTCASEIKYGESQKGSENILIGSSRVTDIPPLPAGRAGLITKFKVDNFGLLEVTVRIRQTGKLFEFRFDISHLLE